MLLSTPSFQVRWCRAIPSVFDTVAEINSRVGPRRPPDCLEVLAIKKFSSHELLCGGSPGLLYVLPRPPSLGRVLPGLLSDQEATGLNALFEIVGRCFIGERVTSLPPHSNEHLPAPIFLQLNKLFFC